MPVLVPSCSATSPRCCSPNARPFVHSGTLLPAARPPEDTSPADTALPRAHEGSEAWAPLCRGAGRSAHLPHGFCLHHHASGGAGANPNFTPQPNSSQRRPRSRMRWPSFLNRPPPAPRRGLGRREWFHAPRRRRRNVFIWGATAEYAAQLYRFHERRWIKGRPEPLFVRASPARRLRAEDATSAAGDGPQCSGRWPGA